MKKVRDTFRKILEIFSRFLTFSKIFDFFEKCLYSFVFFCSGQNKGNQLLIVSRIVEQAWIDLEHANGSSTISDVCFGAEFISEL